MRIKIDTVAHGPAGKVADAELIFEEGPLSGLRLIGFSIWERRTGSGYNVTFPARQYSVNGERRSFALLRPTTDISSQEHVRTLIVDAYLATLAPAPVQHLATPAGPVSDRSLGTAADYGSRAEPPTTADELF